MTFAFPGGRNEDLFQSPADWISPGNRGGWRRSPPPADGSKVVLLDTDHLWGIGGDRAWVWKTFLRGHHPIYLDPLDADPVREGARRALGDTVRFSKRFDLAASVPDSNVCSSGYALVNRTPGHEEILAWFPRGRGRIDLRGIDGDLRVEWFNPETEVSTDGGRVEGDGKKRIMAPWRGEAVAHLRRGPTELARFSR